MGPCPNSSWCSAVDQGWNNTLQPHANIGGNFTLPTSNTATLPSSTSFPTSYKDAVLRNIKGQRVRSRIGLRFYFPLIISCLRGEYTGDYRNPLAIIATLRKHHCPNYIINDIHRVLTVGAPAQFKYKSTTTNLSPFIKYGNHSSVTNNTDIVKQAITKELDRSYAIALPAWTIPFIPHLHLSPLGIVIKEGKKPRLVIDHSFEPTLDTICVNRMHHLTTEIAIEYGSAMMRHLIRIANLRISFPSSKIYLFDTDVTGAFRHVKYNLFVASAFSYTATGWIVLPTAQDFGSTTSPSITSL